MRQTANTTNDEWLDAIDPQAPAPAPVPAALPAPEPTDDESFLGRVRALGARQGLDRMKVKLYRRIRGSADLEFCRDYLPSEFEADDLDAIRQAWGPGSYELRVMGPKGILLRESVTLARGLDAPPAPAPAGPSTDALAQVLAQLAQGQAQIVQALSTRPDPSAAMRDTLSLMVAMREAMGLNQAPAPVADPTAILGGIVGAIRQLREVSAEISPPQPAADPSDPMALLPSVLDLVRVGMESRQALPAPQAVAPIALPPSMQPDPPPVEAAPNPAPESDEEPMQHLILRTMAARLLSMAERKAPAADAAALILNYAPDELLEAIESPDWKSVLYELAPGARQHEAWVSEVRAAVMAGLENDAQGDPPAP